MTEDRVERIDGMEIVTRRDGWVELVAPNQVEFLEKIERLFGELVDAEFEEGERDDLRYALNEICQNAWEWGNRKDAGRKIRVSYCIFAGQVVIKIEDEGEGFDPGTVPDPSRNLRGFLVERAAAGKRPGGFGLHMVKKIMNQVVFNEKGNIVILSKELKRRRSS